MKHIKWIALAALIVVVVAGAVGYWQYGQGKQAGITEGLAAETASSRIAWPVRLSRWQWRRGRRGGAGWRRTGRARRGRGQFCGRTGQVDQWQ